ncbi:MAG: RluA family pseudouridine synthase [Sphingomonadaceae bacterium]
MLPPILLETPRFWVLDKPAGLAVHPGPKTPHSLEQLLPAGHAPVHRLDRDTSGCLMVGRRPSSTKGLMALFAAGGVRKTYWAVLENLPDDQGQGFIDAPLAKISSRERGWRMIVSPDGKPARTAWKLLARQGAYALVEFRPETGRTHQLRVHANLIGPGTAIFGDPVYGKPHPAGMLLHARSLTFTDPWEETEKTVEAPCPDRFAIAGFSADGLAEG